MAALPFNVVISNRNPQPRQVAEAVIFNAPGVPGADGVWNFANAPGVFSLDSQGGVVGASGALRIQQVGLGGVDYVVAFGYWAANNQMWIGVAGDVAGQGTAQVLQDFYGGGQWNQPQFWGQLNVFAFVHPVTQEVITITVNAVGGALNTEVRIG